MASSKLIALYREVERRRKLQEAIDSLHPGQRRWLGIDEPTRYSAALLPRRQGKSYGALFLAGYLCSTKPGARCLYITRTRSQALTLAQEHIERAKRLHGWDCFLRLGDAQYVWPGIQPSTLHIAGADHDRFFEQWRGPSYDLVIIDEAQSLTHIDLGRFVHEVIGPALPERDGRVILLGTPGYEDFGYFYEACETDKHPRVVVHRAPQDNPHENPYTRQYIEAELEALRAVDPSMLEEPRVRREYYGEWVADNRDNVIQLTPERNYITEWTPTARTKYVLGIDFGFDDPSAFCVAAYEPGESDIVYLEGQEARELLLHPTISIIRDYMDRYPGIRLVADPGGNSKAIVEEMRRTHGLPLENAKKGEKFAHIERLNSEAALGRVKLFHRADPSHPELHPLAIQWRSLQWIRRGQNAPREEGRPRHLHDAALYARRACPLFEPQAVRPPIDEAEAMKMRALRSGQSKRGQWLPRR